MQHVMKVLERDGQKYMHLRHGAAPDLVIIICCVKFPASWSHIADEAFVILVQEDITVKRKNEQEVHRMNQTLERRVSERTRELQEKMPN
jgi:hypothetical protein